MRTIWLEGDATSVGIIDQTLLPHRFATARLTTLDDAVRAIRTMQVRGAPLIGATAAYGVWLALRADASDENLERAYAALLAARPTAINLKWALDQMLAAVRNRPRAERSAVALHRANELADEDVAINLGDRPVRIENHWGDRGAEKRRARQPAHPLQRRLAGDGRLGHGDGADLHGARQGFARARIRRRDAAAQPGCLVDRLGARPAWRAAYRDPGQYRRPFDAARPGRSGDRRHRPRHRARRRLQQDRHLLEGAGSSRQQGAVLCGAAVAHHRFHGQRWANRNPDRAARA